MGREEEGGKKREEREESESKGRGRMGSIRTSTGKEMNY